MLSASTGIPVTSTASVNLTAMSTILPVPYTPSVASTPTICGFFGAKISMSEVASDLLSPGAGNDMSATTPPPPALPVMLPPLRIRAPVPL